VTTLLLNECESISREDASVYLAGIDDAHFYRVDNIEKAAAGISQNGFSILLSHTSGCPSLPLRS